MKNHLTALRYLISALAVSAALSLVSFAQHAAGKAINAGALQTQAPKEMPADRVAALVMEWTRAKDYTKEYIDAMPEDGLGFKPTPEVRSFAEQMLHLAGGNYLFGQNVLGAAPPPIAKDLEKNEEVKKSKAALNKVVADSYDFVIGQVKALTPAKLNEEVTLFRMKMPRDIALAKAFEHQTHHRGQTTVYLRLKGVKPPNERLF